MTILNDMVEQKLISHIFQFNGSIGEYIGIVIIAIQVILSCAIILKACSEREWVYLFWLAATALIIGISFYLTFFKNVYKDVHTYEIITNDQIPFVEIMDKYDLIERRGNIFVIKDREEE